MKKTIQGALKNTYHYRGLIKQLVSRDIKLKYRRSVLGYFWSVLNPLLTMLIMSIVFSHMFRFKINNYPVYLLCGNIIYSFFNLTTNRSCNAILSNAALIRKVYLPKYIFVFSKVTSGFVDFLLSLVALVFVMIITKNSFGIYNLLFFIPCIELYLFCLGVGLFLAQANVFFRDIQYIYGVCCTAIMYLTPLFYPIDVLPQRVRFFVEHFNPLYLYVDMFRQSILLNVPTNPGMALRGLLWALGAIFIGGLCFKKNQGKFILFM